MTVAESASRVDEAYEWLLREITSFRVRSGSALSENKVATQLGISRTPVREALQRLEKEGLVKRTENARFAVASISRSEVNDACDLLEVLDTYIFTRAAEKLSESDIQAIMSSVEMMQTAAGTGDREVWAEADQAFHRTVNFVAGNTLVADTVKQVRRRIQRFWIRSASLQERLEGCSREHLVLAEAMTNKDYEAIAPAVKHHIGHMRRSILDMLDSVAAFLGED